MKMRPVKTDRRTDMTKLIVAFLNIRKRLKILHGTHIALMCFMWISEQAMTFALYTCTTNRLGFVRRR